RVHQQFDKNTGRIGHFVAVEPALLHLQRRIYIRALQFLQQPSVLTDQIAIVDLTLLTSFGHRNDSLRKQLLRTLTKQQNGPRRNRIPSWLWDNETLFTHKWNECFSSQRSSTEFYAVLAQYGKREI